MLTLVESPIRPFEGQVFNSKRAANNALKNGFLAPGVEKVIEHSKIAVRPLLAALMIGFGLSDEVSLLLQVADHIFHLSSTHISAPYGSSEEAFIPRRLVVIPQKTHYDDLRIV